MNTPLGLQIIATGAAVPQKAVSNEEMRQFVDTSDEWIQTRTGIANRYFCTQNESCTTLAIAAAQSALQQAGLCAQDIGVCLVATFTPQYATPSTACLVQQALGLAEDTLCMDINAACSGFLYALHTAHALLHTAKKPYALVIGAEQLSRILDFTDRSTCVLFGDGAGAALVKRSESHPYYSLHGARGDVSALSAGGAATADMFLHMDGQAVFRFAVEAITSTISQLMQQAAIAPDALQSIVCHQANSRILALAAKKLQLPQALFYKNMQRYGNTSAASIPLALHELFCQNALPKGSRVLLVGFGAGLTWGGAMLTI